MADQKELKSLQYPRYVHGPLQGDQAGTGEHRKVNTAEEAESALRDGFTLEPQLTADQQEQVRKQRVAAGEMSQDEADAERRQVDRASGQPFAGSAQTGMTAEGARLESAGNDVVPDTLNTQLPDGGGETNPDTLNTQLDDGAASNNPTKKKK